MSLACEGSCVSSGIKKHEVDQIIHLVAKGLVCLLAKDHNSVLVLDIAYFYNCGQLQAPMHSFQ